MIPSLEIIIEVCWNEYTLFSPFQVGGICTTCLEFPLLALECLPTPFCVCFFSQSNFHSTSPMVASLHQPHTRWSPCMTPAYLPSPPKKHRCWRPLLKQRKHQLAYRNMHGLNTVKVCTVMCVGFCYFWTEITVLLSVSRNQY